MQNRRIVAELLVVLSSELKRPGSLTPQGGPRRRPQRRRATLAAVQHATRVGGPSRRGPNTSALSQSRWTSALRQHSHLFELPPDGLLAQARGAPSTRRRAPAFGDSSSAAQKSAAAGARGTRRRAPRRALAAAKPRNASERAAACGSGRATARETSSPARAARKTPEPPTDPDLPRRSPGELTRYQNHGARPPPPLGERGKTEAQAQAFSTIPELFFHGRQVPGLLQHHDGLFARADDGALRLVLDDALPADGRQSQTHGGLLLPKEARLSMFL